MKKARFALAVACLCLSLAMVCVQAQAASPMISLSPGDTLGREFLLYDAFNPRNLGPAQLFLVIGTGDNDTLLGDLSISVKSSVTEEFGTDIDITVRGLSMPLPPSGMPNIFSQVTTVPNEAKKTIKFNSVYGLALVVIYISNFEGDTYGAPVKFTATFSMSTGTGTK